MAFKLQFKRKATAPTTGALDVGEPGYDTTKKRLYVGNGAGQNATPLTTGAYTIYVQSTQPSDTNDYIWIKI